MEVYKSENLTSTNVLVIALMGMTASGIWITYKLNGFKLIPKINDEKGILIPSLFFLISPFLFVYLYSNWKNNFVAGGRAFIPVLTFMLCQILAKNDKRQDLNRKSRESARTIAIKLETHLIEALKDIEISLMRCKDGVDSAEKTKMLCEKYGVTLYDDYQAFCAKFDLLEIKAALTSIYFFKKTKDLLEYYREILDKNVFSIILDMLVEIRLLKIEGCCNLIALNQGVIKSEEDLRAIKDWLKRENKRLKRMQQAKNIRIESSYSNSDDKHIRNQELNRDLLYDIDTEEEVIQYIEETLLKLEVNPSVL